VGAGAIALAPGTTLFLAHDAVAHHDAGRWACPMLCVITHRPGTCPVCGMTMEPMQVGAVNREQRRRMGVQTVPVAQGPAVATVRAAGSAEYDERFAQAVIARIGGRIVKRHEATFGCCQDVAVGDPIIDLYSPEAFQAQGELAAALRTGDASLVAAIEARFARWNLAHVAAAIRAGGEPSDTVTIRSPMAGQAYLEDQAMVNTTLMVGAEIRADMPLLKLVDITRLALVFHVPEGRMHLVRQGQSVALASDDLGDLPDVTAVVGRVANEIDPQIRTREVRVYLDNRSRRILPGALLTARIRGVLAADLTPADPSDRSTWGTFTLIPRDAVLSTGVRHVAWRVDRRTADGEVSFAPVTLALGPRIEDDDGNDRYIVRSGLAPGDEVAARGLFLIDSQAQLAGSASLMNAP
jgi:Cu(I)/Ag(I) efflux system membrane fusion protein